MLQIGGHKGILCRKLEVKKGYNRSNLSPHLNEFTTKDLVRGKLTATNECIKKISNNLNIFLRELEKEQTKPQVSRRKEK